MADRNLVSMAQQFTGLPIDSLIAAPLNAAARANAAMAATQTKFMLDTCFKTIVTGDNKTYEPILISMKLTRGVISKDESGNTKIQPVVTSFKLPILTVIPLNSLAVKTADVHFEMEVKSSFSEDISNKEESNLKGEGGFEAKVGFGPFSATVHGNVSYEHKDSSTHDTHYAKSNSAKYSIDITSGQIPLPQGVTTIIGAFTKTIEPLVLPQDENNDPKGNPKGDPKGDPKG